MDSLVVGNTDEPLLEITIGEALNRAAERWGHRLALVDRGQGVRFTWQELRERVDRLALGLDALGLRRGDRIGIWSLNRFEWTLTQFAAARLGLILVTVNPAYRASELEFVLRDSGCAALVVAPGFKMNDYVAILRQLLPELDGCGDGELRSALLPDLRRIILLGPDPCPGTIGFGAVERLGAAGDCGRLIALSAALNPGDPINIQFTSGTTGSPKGVTLLSLIHI